MTVDIFMLSVLAPLTPAILWGGRQIRQNSCTAEDLEKMQTHIEKTWNDAQKGTQSDDALRAESALIQNHIFHSRSRGPFVFNWLYKVLRGEKEKSMHPIADQLADQALGRAGASSAIERPAWVAMLSTEHPAPKSDPRPVPAIALRPS